MDIALAGVLDPAQLALAVALAALVAGGGYVTEALSRGGALAALFVGTAVFGLGGPLWGLLLVAFFVSSSVLSEWRAEDKADAARRIEKGRRRDAGQVLANGGIAAALAVAQPLSAIDLLPAYVGAMAAVTADTWATEIGLLSPVPPRLITTREVVPPGVSGGVTVLGTTAAVVGGMFIGVTAALLVAVSDIAALGVLEVRLLNLSGARLLVLGTVAGLTSTALDSYLGATAQAVYRDPDGGLTERPTGRDGRPARRAWGWPWVTNDVVNLVAALAGALLAGGLDWLVFG